jgi:DNA-binding transcriptional LysR family regulator
MQLHDLEEFRMLAEELHFSRAAFRLHMDTSTLSRHLRLFERELGVTLVVRNARSVRLTTVGSALLSEAVEILDRIRSMEKMVRTFDAESSRPVKIGYTRLLGTAALAPVLAWVREQWPQLRIQLHESRSTRLLEMLADEKVDLILVHHYPYRSDVAANSISQIPLIAAFPSRYAGISAKSIDLSYVLSQALVIPMEGDRNELRSVLEGLCRPLGHELRSAAEAAQSRSLLPLVAAGYGPAIIPATYVSEDTDGSVIFRPFAPPQPYVPLFAAWRVNSIATSTLDLVHQLVARLRWQLDFATANSGHWPS